MSSVNKQSSMSLSIVDPVPKWENLFQIQKDLKNAQFISQQKVFLIGEKRIPQQEVIDRIVALRPRISGMKWDGPYLNIARRIKKIAEEVGYQPKISFWTWCVEKFFVCTLTQGCRERTLFEDGELTEEQLSAMQFWDDHREGGGVDPA